MNAPKKHSVALVLFGIALGIFLVTLFLFVRDAYNLHEYGTLRFPPPPSDRMRYHNMQMHDTGAMPQSTTTPPQP